MQPKTLAQEPPGPVAVCCAADALGGDHPQAGLCLGCKGQPVNNETTKGQSLALLAGSGEVTSLLDARGAAEPEPAWRDGGHGPARER